MNLKVKVFALALASPMFGLGCDDDEDRTIDDVEEANPDGGRQQPVDTDSGKPDADIRSSGSDGGVSDGDGPAHSAVLLANSIAQFCAKLVECTPAKDLRGTSEECTEFYGESKDKLKDATEACRTAAIIHFTCSASLPCHGQGEEPCFEELSKAEQACAGQEPKSTGVN